MAPAPLVSIVVPVLRDADELEGLLDALATPPQHAHGDYEVIVANGDAEDAGLRAIRQKHPRVRWTDSDPGRAIQMNAGAALAEGEWLFFLHADARMAPEWLREFKRIATPSVVGGAFGFRIAADAAWARFLERVVAWRVRWLNLPYGDQGIFVRRAIFRGLEGYRPIPIMEDVDLIRRLRRIGTLVWSAVPVVVSARRWERDGWLRRSSQNVLLVAGYGLGVSPHWLARRYYRQRPSQTAISERPADRGLRSASGHRVTVIVPALNEADAIGAVLDEIPADAQTVIVVDNGSTDDTVELATAHGARVVREPRRGYGRACLAGLREDLAGELVVFLDADRSDFPAEMLTLLAPIQDGAADMVLGYREGVGRSWSARVGTALCVTLINVLWRTHYRDLGPFRAVRRSALDRLAMKDETWGWTIEMQVKAVEAGLRVVELPIRQRPRLGKSKISGTFVGVVRAGSRMLATVFGLWVTRAQRTYPTPDE